MGVNTPAVPKPVTPPIHSLPVKPITLTGCGAPSLQIFKGRIFHLYNLTTTPSWTKTTFRAAHQIVRTTNQPTPHQTTATTNANTMQFKLSPIVALLLLLFTGTALASYGCYSGGQTWGDIGNDDEVNNGLAALCKNLAGSYALHTEVRDAPMASKFLLYEDRISNPQHHAAREVPECQRSRHPRLHPPHRGPTRRTWRRHQPGSLSGCRQAGMFLLQPLKHLESSDCY